MKKLSACAAFSAFLLPFFIYLVTLCPSVHWGDSGELITAAFTLGIPHPPGHPLYAILGKLFTLLPVGSVAYRVNLMSAFFGAVSCCIVYKIISDGLAEHSWKPAAALGGALFFAFAPISWEQAVVAETTTLHVAFMMLLTWIAFRLASGHGVWRSNEHSLCLFSLLYGLSMTNHVAGVFFAPAFAYVLIATFRKKLFSPRLLAAMLLCFFAGLLVYAYLPIRSLADPPLDWGNPENLKNFFWVVTAKQYAPDLVNEISFTSLIASVGLHAKTLLAQFTPLGCLLALIGLCQLARTDPKFVLFSLIVIAILFYIGLNSAFISAYMVPALALMAVWIGAGLDRSFQWLNALSAQAHNRFRTIAPNAACGLLSAAFLLPLGLNFKQMDRSRDIYALRYGEHLLERLPQNSILFTSDGYALFTLWYLTYCEEKRPDIMVVEPDWLVGNEVLSSQVREQYPDLVFAEPETLAAYASRGETPLGRKFLAIQAILDANAGRRPIFWGVVLNDLPFFNHLIPRAIIYEYSKAPVALQAEHFSQVKDFWDRELDFYRRRPDMKHNKLAQEIYPVELNNQGLMFEALRQNAPARWAIERALDFNPDYPLSRYNLGRFNAASGNDERAITDYQRAIKNNPYMAVAYYNMGNSYRRLNRFDEAFLAYRTASRLYKNYYEAMTALGQLYARVNQHNDAIKEFKKALEVNPDYPFALRGLASSCLATGRVEEARDAIHQALRLEPNSGPCLFVLAKYHARAGNAAGAEAALRRSIEVGGLIFLENASQDADLEALARRMQLAERVK